MDIITLHDVSKIYYVKKNGPERKFFIKKEQEIQALKNITFSVGQGEVLGIIGYNGSGKSTLLKILSKITPPTSGRISIKGKVLALLEVGAGFHSELTGRENIFLNGSILGLTKKEIKNNIGKIIEFSGIEDFIDVQVKKYSSGMYVRLAFSIATAMESDLLFIDEVLALGDIDFQNKCFSYINSITKNKGKTVIIVSHNLDVIQKLCNKCLWLDKGKIRELGETNRVVHSYQEALVKKVFSDLRQRTDRGGNGKIKATKVELLDESGKKVDYFSSGQNVIFVIHYEVNDPSVTEMEIAFPIDSEEIDKRITNNFSEILLKKVKVSGHQGCIKLKINKLPLNVGKYSYDIRLLNDGDYYDIVLKAGYFKVLFGDYYKTGLLPPANHGVILMDYDIVD